LQQQMFSLEALDKRDSADPFAKPAVAAPAVPALPAPEEPAPSEDERKALRRYVKSELLRLTHAHSA
jgi:hypothetical protein